MHYFKILFVHFEGTLAIRSSKAKGDEDSDSEVKLVEKHQ